MSAAEAFADVLDAVTNVEGWLTDDQARRLYDRARVLGAGARVVEIGSFRGRSTIVLASGAGEGIEVVAIDPHGGGDRGPREIEPDRDRGAADFVAFHANLAAAGVEHRVRHIRKPSSSALGCVTGPVDLLYIDGAHRFGPARADIVGWGGLVSANGTMVVHDSFSSVGVTFALLTTTVFGGSWRYVGRSRSMAEFRRVDLSPHLRIPNAARQFTQLGWFARNVIIKVLLVVGAAPLTRLLGHRSQQWPY